MVRTTVGRHDTWFLLPTLPVDWRDWGTTGPISSQLVRVVGQWCLLKPGWGAGAQIYRTGQSSNLEIDLKGEINLSQKKILRNLDLGAQMANPEGDEWINISKHQSGLVWRLRSKCTPSKKEEKRKTFFFVHQEPNSFEQKCVHH